MMLRFASGQGLRFASLRRFWRPVVAGLAMAAELHPVSRLDSLVALVVGVGVGVGVAVCGAALILLGGIRLRRGKLPELNL